MILEAAHVAMRGHAVRTQEVGAVAAASERLLASLAARAHNLHVVYCEHVKDLDQDVVERQRLDATWWQTSALLTERARYRSVHIRIPTVVDRKLRNAVRTEDVQTREYARLLVLLVALGTRVFRVWRG